MAIDLVRMPPELSVGFSARFDFGTAVVRLPDSRGREAVRTIEMPDRGWLATKGVFSKARANEFSGFARARGGAFHGFRFWDPTDFSTAPADQMGLTWAATDQYLGDGNGTRTRFGIRRTYASVPNDLLQRLGVDDRMIPIINEVDDRLARKLGLPSGTTLNTQVAVAGTPVSYAFDYQAREFVLAAAPGSGLPVTWGGPYDWPVWIDEQTDANLERIAESWEAHNFPRIGLELIPFERWAPETDDPGGCGTLTWAGGVPLIQKVIQKNWILNPLDVGLSVQIEDVTRHNAGGPHLVLVNITVNPVAAVDTLTGTTLFTVGAAGSLTSVARLWSRDNGPTLQWFWTLGPA